MSELPPLECLRYFEVAARHESFVRAAREIGVTPAAVAYRIKVMEEYLGRALFARHQRRVTLNANGRACLRDVQRVLAEIGVIAERYGSRPSVRQLTVAAVESIADRWLMPKLPGFRALEPDIAIRIETDLAGTGPGQPDVDLWIAYAGEEWGPPASEAQHETLFEEPMFPVCSPALLEERPQPGRAADLHRWPLLYHLGRPSDWTHWFAAHKTMAPDLYGASGFRLCSMLVHAAVQGMGVAIGRPTMVAGELQDGSLVPLLKQHTEPHTSCCLISTPAARSRPQVRSFRDWILQESAAHRPAPAADAT